MKISSSGNKKIKKQLTMKSDTRKNICLYSSRVWNMPNACPPSPTNKGVRFRYSYLTPQLDNIRVMESMLGITGLSYNFSFMSLIKKKMHT